MSDPTDLVQRRHQPARVAGFRHPLQCEIERSAETGLIDHGAAQICSRTTMIGTATASDPALARSSFLQYMLKISTPWIFCQIYTEVAP